MLGFPCNQFGAQEPGTDAEILEFATSKYGATFPLFSKIEVNGSGACELYHTLPSPKPNQKPHPRRNTVTSAKPSPRPSRKKSATPALAPC